MIPFGSEPGIPDLLAIYYDAQGGQQAWAIVLWIEIKRPGARQDCRCKVGRARKCTSCAQAAWKQREEARGAAVWTVR